MVEHSRSEKSIVTFKHRAHSRNGVVEGLSDDVKAMGRIAKLKND